MSKLKKKPEPDRPPLVVRRSEIARLLGISVRLLDDLVAKGEGPPCITLGDGHRSRLFPVRLAEAWAAERCGAPS